MQRIKELFQNFWFLSGLFVVFKLTLHFLTSTNYELHRDEMLYFAMGNHLDWGFASTPPLMSFLSFIIIKVFGYHEFFIKLFPALAGSLMLIIIALFIKELGGGRAALVTASSAHILSTAMLRSSSLFMPVIFELFFWLLILFFVLKLINRQDPKYWLWLGVSFGLAFLNKYSVLVLGGSTVLAILISKHRKLLFSKYVLYAFLLFLLIISPNVIWQISHNLPVVTHMSELYRTQLVHVSAGSFFLDQLLMNSSVVLIWMPGLIGVLFFRQEKKYRLFGYIMLLVVLLFLISKGKSYYTLGVYPVMFAFGGYIFEKYFRKQLALIVSICFIQTIIILPFGLPILKQESMKKYSAFFSEYITNAPMRNEDNGYYPIPQDYMDMTGWDELARLVSQAYDRLTREQSKRCTIYANNYGQAGAIDFYGKKYNLPGAVSLNDSYVFWAPDSLTSDIFIVSDHSLGDIPNLFESYQQVGEIDNDCFRENGLKVYLCQNPKPVLYDFYRNRVKEHKALYGF